MIPKGRIFHGLLDDSFDEEILRSICDAVETEGVGAKTTYGLGRIELKVEEAPYPSLKERFENFNKSVSEDGEMGEGLAFTLTLQTPAILFDMGVPTLVPSLQRVKFPRNWVAQPDEVGGWSEAWGLPKPVDPAAAAGCCYLYFAEGNPSDLLSFLHHLEKEGIGLRKDEGFGEVRICDPIHSHWRWKSAHGK